ncbi:hypothetical protein PTKIN_Ptkin01aG0265100 [Pterospermum kingtungense]
MASGTTPQVRLVRCPKCLLVLPEVADFPVYKCGGCDKILVAKNRKAIVKSTSLLQETEAVHSDESVHVSEHGDQSGSLTPQETLPSPPEHHLSQESGGNQNVSSDSQNENHDESLSIEGKHNDQNTSSDIDHDCDDLDENGSNEGQQNGSEQLQSEYSEYGSVQEPGVSTEGALLTELHHEKKGLMLVAEENVEAEANDKTLQLEIETTNKIDSNIGGSGSSSIDNSPATKEINLTVTACAAAGEAISSDNLFSSNEQPQKSGHRGFDRLRSTDTFVTADFVSVSSEFSGPLEYLSKSNTRSSHAYDGSISSFDGMEDHFPDQQLHSFKNDHKAANYLVPEVRHRTDKLPPKGLMNRNSGMQDHARNVSSDLSNKKHYATARYRKWQWHRDGALEPVLHHHPHGNWPRLESDEYPSQIPFTQRVSLRRYESAGPSRELHDEFPFKSAFIPIEKAEHSGEENVKLLRMVNELRDQSSKLNGQRNGRTSTHVPRRQKHYPAYYYQEPPEEEIFYPRHHVRHGHRSSWNQQSRFSRIPFSGGALNTGYDIDKSCLCCHRQAWPRSEQLPPPVFRHSRGYTSYSSCPSSTQRHLESDFSIWSHETKCDDQRYRDHELKRYLREKNHSVRRHIRPRAGGAPFVTCYHCLRPLQVPADFLLFKRRFHQLRCGACSKILTFSLQRGTRIVPYEPVTGEPAPSETEECSDVINVRILKSESCSHGCLEADTFHCDYGRSRKSCSMDGIPVSHAQFHHLQGNAHVKKMSCSSSNKPMEPRKGFVLKQPQQKHKNSMETIDSAGPSSNRSMSEKMEFSSRRTRGWRLHQLMGFSSPSQVINGVVPSTSDTNSGSNSSVCFSR